MDALGLENSDCSFDEKQSFFIPSVVCFVPLFLLGSSSVAYFFTRIGHLVYGQLLFPVYCSPSFRSTGLSAVKRIPFAVQKETKIDHSMKVDLHSLLAK